MDKIFSIWQREGGGGGGRWTGGGGGVGSGEKGVGLFVELLKRSRKAEKYW